MEGVHHLPVLLVFGPVIIAVVCAFVAPLTRRPHRTDAIREPPYIRSYIPLVGHLIGMIRKGASYFEYINKDNLPIFTLPILTSRNYVVTDATLAGLIQRNGKTMSFYSLIVEVTRRLIAFDADATRITFHNMNGEHGPGGLMSRVHEMVNRHLGPGPLLDAIVTTQITAMGKSLAHDVPTEGVIINLYAWQRRVFSLCNMKALYGPENIFATDSELEVAFWDFEQGMLGLVVDILPWLTARSAFQARRKVLDGLIRYVKEKRYKTASPLIRERIETNLEYGMSEDMAGHSELILMFGILGNAVPSAFWLIVNLYSRPELLAEIREEVQVVVQASSNEKAKELIAISAKRITMRSCPLLYSCYRETLREVSLLTSARLVLEDTVLAEQYLLRKRSVVQIAGGVLGRDPNVWGPDGKDFNPYRFLSKTYGRDGSDRIRGAAVPMPEGVPSAAFRAFGGGTVICPGRHFAQTELMVFAASLVLFFDITEPSGDPLRLPAKDETRIPLSVMKPALEPIVKIQRRTGWENVVLDLQP